MAMYRMSNQKACFLGDSTLNLPKPEVLARLLEIVSDFFEVVAQSLQLGRLSVSLIWLK